MAEVAKSVVALLADLVAINSVNASMAASPGERDAADFVAAFGRRIGAETSLEDVLPGRPNVRVTLPATRRPSPLSAPPEQPARRLLFDVHLDTVPLEPMEQALTPRIEHHRGADGVHRTALRVPLALVPAEVRAVGAFAIAGGLFLAHAPVPGPVPDFHQPDLWTRARLAL